MKKVDALQKCVISNKVLQFLNSDELEAGETVTIVITTKKNGELKSMVVKKGEESHEV